MSGLAAPEKLHHRNPGAKALFICSANAALKGRSSTKTFFDRSAFIRRRRRGKPRLYGSFFVPAALRSARRGPAVSPDELTSSESRVATQIRKSRSNLAANHWRLLTRASPLATFSAARSFALRDRGLRSISSSVAVTGFLVSSRYRPCFAPSRNASLTILSSSE